jgi:hypothetical protein
MTEAIRRAQPFVWGVVAGILLTVIVGFSTGWVVTAGAKERAIWTAKIDRLAVICATQSTSQWQAEGKDSAALRGWENREQRGALAEGAMAAWPLEDRLKREVIEECGRLLDA